MILDVALAYDTKKAIKNAPSTYRPDKEDKDRIQQILRDFGLSRSIAGKPYREFNDYSVMQRQSIDQAIFNGYVEPPSLDVDENWKSRAVRPIARNRAMSIAAHVTAALIYPQIYAQNKDDHEDKDAEVVMRDLMEYVLENAEYGQRFLYAVIAALVNPAAILHVEYSKRYRTIKEIGAKGKWTKKQILDEAYSGLQLTNIPLDELYIGDIYEHDIQKQPFVIWRRALDWSQALAKYADNKLFQEFVRPGLQILYDEPTDTFYESFDPALRERLVEEVIYYNRTGDLQCVLVNGILISDPEQPNPRKDKKYPFIKGGYQLFDEGKFFYYSSLIKNLWKDEEVLTQLYRALLDGAILQGMPPVAVFGNEEVDSSVITPGTVTQFKDNETKLQKIDVGNNLNALTAAVEKVERSISETSQDTLQSGQAAGGQQTAFEISRLEQNAQVMLGIFAKMIGFMVKDLGELVISDIIQFVTVAEGAQITGDTTRAKFQAITIPNKLSNGKKKTRRIEFSQNQGTLPPLEESFNILQEQGGLDSELEIYKVNPKAFRDLKFKVKILPETISPPSDSLKKALNLELFDRAIQLPFANQEAIARDFLFGSYDASKANTDKYVKSPQEMQAEQMQQTQQGQQTTLPQKPDIMSKLFGGGNVGNKVVNAA